MAHASRQRASGRPADSPRTFPGGRLPGGAGLLACALCLANAAPAWAQAEATPGIAFVPPPGTAASAPDARLERPPVNLPPRLAVEVRTAATSNSGVDDNGLHRADLITSLRPSLDMTHKGAGLEADVHAAATVFNYARGTQPDGVLPDLSGKLAATLLERALAFDASGYLRAQESDPFGVRTSDVTATNRRNDWGFLAGPTAQLEFGPNASLLARHQFGATRAAGSGDGSEVRLDSNLSLVRLERKPTPLGASAEFTRLDNHSRSDAGTSHYILATGRLRGSVRVGGDATFSALVGQDRSDYLLSSHSDPLYGAGLDWSPGPRTHLALELEHRYFGQSGQFRFDHRTPFLTIAVDLRREPVDATSSFGALAQGTDVRSALDAILTTRYPDPTTRASVVDSLVASRGLGSQTSGAIDLLGDYPQLQTSARFSLTLLGARDTLSLSGYGLTSRVLTHDGDPLAGLSSTAADNRQRGASFQLEHRLGPELTAALLGNWSRIQGLGAGADRSEQQSWRLSLLEHVSRRSDLMMAIQWFRFETTAAGQHSYDATLGLIGLSHRF